MPQDVPKHLWRYPTPEAIDSLAKRFDLPNDPGMQDWEYQVADSSRVDEFLSAYQSGELSKDERFVLMEMLLQSCEEIGPGLANFPLWARVLSCIEQDIEIHIGTVWYWSGLDSDPADAWTVTPWMRDILARHRSQFETVPVR